VAAVIGQKGELVLAGRHADHEVEVGDTFSLGAQSATLFSEEPRVFFIDTNKGQISAAGGAGSKRSVK
jgi:hypothetical protein